MSGLGVRGPARIEDATLPVGTRALRIQLTVDDGGGGLGAVDVFVDGHNAGRTDTAAPLSTRLQIAPVVSLQAGATSRIRIRAYDRLGLYAETPDLLVHLPGDTAPHEQDLYVLAVGIDGYGEGLHSLKSAVADAQTFASTVASLKPETYQKLEPIRLLTDKKATRTTILAALDDIARQAQPDDAVLVYLAGHGMVQQDQYVFVPSDVVDRSGQITGGLGEETLVKALSRIQAQRIFLFLDTCYAGGFNMKAPANLSQETGYFVLTASTSVEEALDSYDNINGVFAVAVHRALTGGAVMGGISDIDALSVGDYVHAVLPRLAGARGHQQMATFKAGNGNLREFPIAAVKH